MVVFSRVLQSQYLVLTGDTKHPNPPKSTQIHPNRPKSTQIYTKSTQIYSKDQVSDRKRKLNSPNHKHLGKHPKRAAAQFAPTKKQKTEECVKLTDVGSHPLWDAAQCAPTTKYPERSDAHCATKHQESEECITAKDVGSHPLWDPAHCSSNKQTTETASESDCSFSHFPEMSVSTEERSDDSLYTMLDSFESMSKEKLNSSSPNISSETETASSSVSPLTVKNDIDDRDSILENSGDVDNLITKLSALPRSGTFMTNEEVIDVIMNTKTPENVVPSGQKDNCYVVLKIEGIDKNQKNYYADDCGVWDWKTATTVNQTFAVEGPNRTLRAVYKKNGKYCIKKVVKGKHTYPPLEPQPEQILGMHRYYTKLSSDDTYKKRVTIITDLPQSLKVKENFALVEYCGKMPPNTKKHGNTKAYDGAPYTRTNPNVLSRAAQMAKHKKVAKVFTELTEEDSFLAPKSTRQITDKIYHENKRKKDTAALGSRVNIADDVAVAIGALNSDPYIQEVILTKDKKPAVIVYSDDQLTDMKRNCIGDDCSVLGVDRTFNLGRFYVTTISYKNRCVLRKRTNDYPVMFGPCLIHFDAEESTYGKFFSHVSDKIGDAKTVIGSDEEKSMTNALKKKFPNSEFLLCTKHIKDNIRRYLEETGTNLKDRETVLKIIFEEKEGIIYSDSEGDFEINCEKLQPFFENNTKFKLYWLRFMYDKLREYVFRPLCKGTVSRAWTNNNSESMNHKLKAAVDWQKNKFPELIQEIGSIMKNQVTHLKCALFGKGDFKLTTPMQNHFVNPTVWHGLSKTDKNEKFKKFMSAKPKTEVKSKFVKATHIQLQCPVLTDNVGKKPGQRKRQASERTSSFNK
jgi:molybdopterin converting factor small subunit